jgi:hypothetical protein
MFDMMHISQNTKTISDTVQCDICSTTGFAITCFYVTAHQSLRYARRGQEDGLTERRSRRCPGNRTPVCQPVASHFLTEISRVIRRNLILIRLVSPKLLFKPLRDMLTVTNEECIWVQQSQYAGHREGLAGLAVALWIRTQKMLGSNIGCDISYADWCASCFYSVLPADCKLMPPLVRDHFQLVTPLSSYHCTLYKLTTDSRIWGSDTSGYKELYLLGYIALQSVENQLSFRRNMSLPSKGSKYKPSKKSAWSRQQLLSASCWFIAWQIAVDTYFMLVAWLNLWPWRWRWRVPPKRRLTSNSLHGVTSQNI